MHKRFQQPERLLRPGRASLLFLRDDGGFSLIELSVTIFILALLLGSVLVPLATQMDQRRISQTQRQLEVIKEALIGYAIIHRHLPCPAVSATNGAEDRTGTACTGGKRVGFLPWAALGLDAADAWDNLFRYSVSASHSTSDPATRFGLDDTGDITIKTRDNAGVLVNMSNSPGTPVVILSHGKNSFGATARSGAARFTPGSWVGDERDNANMSTTFIWRVRSEVTGAAGGQFDDLVAWVTPNILNARMVAAGRLP